MFHCKNINSYELNNMIENKTKLLLLDVRTEEEYEANHIPSAINIPLNELDTQLTHLETYKNEAVVIYCRSGKRSLIASKLLYDNGFNNIYNLTQGIIGHLEYL